MLNDSLTASSKTSKPLKAERAKATLSRVALFLGELRDGLTMVSYDLLLYIIPSFLFAICTTLMFNVICR